MKEPLKCFAETSNAERRTPNVERENVERKNVERKNVSDRASSTSLAPREARGEGQGEGNLLKAPPLPNPLLHWRGREGEKPVRVFGLCGRFIRVLACLGILLITTLARSATNDLMSLLQRGLFEEEANRNLEAAISNYDSLAKAFDQNRQIAATAVFRLGECYRKLGRTNEAANQYQRIVKEFPDQGTLATLSRQNLAGMGLSSAGSSATPGESASTASKMVANAEAEAISLQTQVHHLKALSRPQLREVLQQNYSDPTLTKLIQDLNDAEQVELKLPPTNSLAFQNHVSLMNRINEQIDSHIQGTLLALQNRADIAAETAKALRAQLGESLQSKPPIREDLLSIDTEAAEIERIKTLIENSPDLVNSTAGGETPLCKAAEEGRLRVVNYLLDHGANIDLKCGGSAPLHKATSAGNKAMVELLLKRGADVNATDNTGGTAIHIATQSGFRSVAEVLLANHADPNARKDDSNQRRTPLHFAAALGHIEMMKLLISAGADVNAADSKGCTPIFDAIGTGRIEAVKTLLTAKANLNVQNEKGMTPISAAADKRDWASVQLLLDAKADPNLGVNRALFQAIRYRDAEMTRVLLRAGADPNRASALDSSVFGYALSTSFATNNPLHFACGKNDAEAVKTLLEFKADPNGKGRWDQAVIFDALFNTNVLREMLEGGADPNVGGGAEGGIASRGETPLMVVVRGVISSSGGNYTISDEADVVLAKLLIDHGAHVNARRPKDGVTPLHLAVRRRHQGLVELLLANKADVNAKDDNGKTPLDFVQEQPSFVARSIQILPPPSLPSFPPSGLVSSPDSIAGVLRSHGAQGDLPRPNEIRIARSATGFSRVMFTKGNEDWNQVTVLQTLLHYYTFYHNELVCPDLSSITVIRRKPGSTKEDRQVINFYNGPNRIDCSRDVPLQFGDIVEVPERVHPIGLSVGLTPEEGDAIADCFKGEVFLISGGQTHKLPYAPGITIKSILGSAEARQALLTSSDLSKTKLTKRDLVSGKPRQWTIDCSNPNKLPEIWLRNGDIIEVPNK